MDGFSEALGSLYKGCAILTILGVIVTAVVFLLIGHYLWR